MPARKTDWKRIDAAVRDYALSLPEAVEDFPWDERVVKVRKKIFVFLGTFDGRSFGMGVKLPESGVAVLHESWATPMGYGLGRSGWVSIRFEPTDRADLNELCEMVHESYCAVAPKTLARAVNLGHA